MGLTLCQLFSIDLNPYNIAVRQYIFKINSFENLSIIFSMLVSVVNSNGYCACMYVCMYVRANIRIGSWALQSFFNRKIYSWHCINNSDDENGCVLWLILAIATEWELNICTRNIHSRSFSHYIPYHSIPFHFSYIQSQQQKLQLHLQSQPCMSGLNTMGS